MPDLGSAAHKSRCLGGCVPTATLAEPSLNKTLCLSNRPVKADLWCSHREAPGCHICQVLWGRSACRTPVLTFCVHICSCALKQLQLRQPFLATELHKFFVTIDFSPCACTLSSLRVGEGLLWRPTRRWSLNSSSASAGNTVTCKSDRSQANHPSHLLSLVNKTVKTGPARPLEFGAAPQKLIPWCAFPAQELPAMCGSWGCEMWQTQLRNWIFDFI